MLIERQRFGSGGVTAGAEGRKRGALQLAQRSVL
jgi:hypothetical protein